MIGLDTNVLVRFLVQDDPEQGAAASALIERCTTEDPGYVPREVMIELVWVLAAAYGFGRSKISRALEGLLEAEELRIEAADRVGLALYRFRNQGQDFADTMIALAARDADCTTLYTFDKRASGASETTLIEIPKAPGSV